jgi:hypothetical protein
MILRETLGLNTYRTYIEEANGLSVGVKEKNNSEGLFK